LVGPVNVIWDAEGLGAAKWGTTLTSGLALLLVIHFALCAALMWRMRQICLTKADYYLGRV
jgi:hypothetical protein